VRFFIERELCPEPTKPATAVVTNHQNMRQLLFGFAFIAMVAGIRAMWPRKAQSRGSKSSPSRRPSNDEIARRAYFIGLERDGRGETPDPLRNWIDAEQELFA
jgi:hypothetical protein